jgi:hypothetical protein
MSMIIQNRECIIILNWMTLFLKVTMKIKMIIISKDHKNQKWINSCITQNLYITMIFLKNKIIIMKMQLNSPKLKYKKRWWEVKIAIIMINNNKIIKCKAIMKIEKWMIFNKDMMLYFYNIIIEKIKIKINNLIGMNFKMRLHCHQI